jgi:hypothetical protein
MSEGLCCSGGLIILDANQEEKNCPFDFEN